MQKSNRVLLLLIFGFALLVSGGLLPQEQSFAHPSPVQTGDDEIDRLIKTARSGPDADSREEALVTLAEIVCDRQKELLGESDESVDAETQKQKYEVLALSKRPKDEAVPRLIELARTHPKAVIRRHALYYLGRSADERAIDFFEALFVKARKRD